MKNVIIYTRVSTDEQAKGFSLGHQKDLLENHCTTKGYHIVKHFEEDYSAKNFSSRPSFNKLLRFVKSNHKKIDAILFTKWDRFSRNVEASYRMIRKFKEFHIEVNSVEQPLDLTQPDSKVMLAVYLVIPEVENDKIGLRTKDGLRKAKKMGCYTSKAPYGYKNARTNDGKATLEFDMDAAPLVEGAFHLYAKGIYGVEKVRQIYLKKGLQISKNTFASLLKNPVYMGKIPIKAYKNEEAMLVEGLHPAIIDSDTFEKVQLIMSGRYKPKFRTLSEIDAKLPLRGFLTCPSCGKNLTGSGSKGRGGKKSYFFYHCTRYCGVRFKAREVNGLFEQLLHELAIEEDLETVYKSLLNKRLSDSQTNKQIEIASLQREQQKIQDRLSEAEDKYFDGVIDANTYNNIKIRADERLLDIRNTLKEAQHQDRFFEKHLRQGATFLKDVHSVYQNGSTEIKKKILQTLFPQKLIYTPEYFTTSHLDETLALILFREKELKHLKVAEKSKVAS